MSKQNLNQKLLEIKKRVPFLKPNEKGFNYDYANPSRVLGVFNPLFNEYGILLEPSVVATEVINVEHTKVNKKRSKEEPYYNTVTEFLYVVKMTFTFVDVETGETKVINWTGTGNNGIEQGYGSALTYAIRYFLLSYFNVPVDKEDPNYIQKIKQTGADKKEDVELKKLTKSNVTALKKALSSGAKKPIDVLNSLSSYEEDDNRTEIENHLATL